MAVKWWWWWLLNKVTNAKQNTPMKRYQYVPEYKIFKIIKGLTLGIQEKKTNLCRQESG